MSFAPPAIRALRARPLMVPFRIPPASASGAMPTAPMVALDLETEQGVTGHAYLFAFTPAALGPLASMIAGIGEMIRGEPLAPADLDAKLRRRLTLIDSPGIVGLALAGLDMCTWDALARAAGVPLVVLLGGSVRPVKAYNSCGLWIGDPSKLADQAEQLAAEGGFTAVKVRVGRPDFAQDLAAVRAVKGRVGDRITVMCDFNQSLTWNEAIRRGRALDDEGLYWIEEPVKHDDYAGCARVAEAVRTPIQIGENLLGPTDLRKALEARAMEFVMPDVQRIGGVTGWMRAAAIAQAHGMEMSSHLFPEISAHLLAVTPTCHWLEYMDWAVPILREAPVVKDGQVHIPDRPGTGVEWNEDALTRFAA
jgi:mandelate racemase